ncbi:MAG: tetratricopeptide repeat protein [Planctomycetota bacterium]
MPTSDPGLQKKRITRLLIVVGVLVLLAGGFVALYQLNRPTPHIATEAEIIDDAKAAYADEDYETVVELLETSSNRDVTLPGIQDDPEALRIYITARQDQPEFNDRHLTRIVAPLQQLIELNPEDRDIKLELLDTLLELERDDAALALTDELVVEYPDDAEILRRRAQAQLQNNQFDEARLTLEQAIELEPLDVTTHAQLLDIVTDNDEQLEPFAQRARTIFDQHKDDPRAALVLVMAYEAQGNNAQAMDLLRQASKMTPPEPGIVLQLVQWLDRSGMNTLAYEYLKQHAEQGIDSPAGQLAVYRAFETGEYEVMLGRLSGSDPEEANTDMLAMWVGALIEVGDETSEQQLNALVKRDDIVARTWAKLHKLDQDETTNPGQIIDLIAKALDAEDEYERAAARRHPYLMQRLGEAYMDAEEPEIAYSALMVAARNSRTWARPHRALAENLIELGQPDAAVFHAKQALTRQGDPASRKWLAVAMAAAGNPNDQGYVDRVVAETDKLPGGSSEAWDTMPSVIDLLARAERDEEATTRVTEALANQDAIRTDTLESLLQVSRRHELGLDAMLTQAIESKQGMTPGLALLRAQGIAETDGNDKALAWLEAEIPEPATKRWQVALTDFLISTGSDQAGEALIDLANAHPQDITLQVAALEGNRPAEQDERFTAVLERLRKLAGEATIHWRLQQARIPLLDPGNDQALRDVIALLSEAEPLTPVHSELRIVLARCYLLLGEDLAAAERAQAARSIDPYNPFALLLHGKALHQLKRYEDARLDLTRVTGDVTLDPAMRLQACVMLFDQGAYEPVRKTVEQMWSANQANSTALILLARIYIREGDFTKADAICDALLKQPDARALRFVATYAHQTGRPDRVQQALEAAQSDRISQADRLVILAEDAARRGEIAQAVKQVEASVQADPENPQRWSDAVQLLLSVAQPMEAARLAKRGANALPDEAGLSSLAKQEKLIQQIKADASLIPLAVTLLTSDSFRGQAIRALQVTRDMGRSDEAANELADLAQSYPEFKYLQELACDRLLRAGLDERAYPLAKSAMARFPDSAATARVAALTAFRLQDWPMLLSAANAWAKRNPQDRANADLMRAAAMNQLDRYTATLDTLRPYIRTQDAISPSNELMFEYYILALVRTGDHPSAWQALKPSIPTSVQARTIGLKRISEDLEDEQVIREWHAVIAEHSDSGPRAQFELAKAPFLAGQRLDNDELVRLANQRLTQQILVEGENNIDMVYAKGQIAQRLGDFEAAEAAYRMVLASVKDNPLVLNNLALVLSQRGDSSMAEAEQLARRAVKLVDDEPNLIDTLAIILMRSGQYDKALATIEQAILIDPSDPAWHLTKADILEAKGEPEQADVIRQRYAPIR